LGCERGVCRWRHYASGLLLKVVEARNWLVQFGARCRGRWGEGVVRDVGGHGDDDDDVVEKRRIFVASLG
jgi:hypothetical protein